jgi:sulfur-oxidizing protein SoxY
MSCDNGGICPAAQGQYDEGPHAKGDIGMTGASWPRSIAFTIGIAIAASLGPAAAADPDTAWKDIREMLFAERPIEDGAGVIHLAAPQRAHDAAIVPIEIVAEIPQTPERYIRTVHLVIDQNPAPVAAVFHLTPDSGRATIATRVRINEYTNVRAIAETSDGQLHMASRFVKASGGCSAPALKDHEQAIARLGQMKIKPLTPFQPGSPNETQLLISHPNYSGMQMDPLSRHWIPPHYVREIHVSYDGRPIMRVDGDISLSENPSIHFSFVPQGPGELRVRVVDSEEQEFSAEMALGGAAES